jgi:hypothetical protein
VKPLPLFVSGFVLGVMTSVIAFIAAAILFPGERTTYRLTSDLIFEDVAEIGEFAEQSVQRSDATTVIRKGRHLFVNVKKGELNYISIETAITDDTLAAYTEPVTATNEN